jgi:hypothetical protein
MEAVNEDCEVFEARKEDPMLRRISRFIALLLLITPLLAACGNQAGADTAEFNTMFRTAQAGALAQQGSVAATHALDQAQKSAKIDSAKRGATTATLPESWNSLWERLSDTLNRLPGTTNKSTESSFWDRIYQRYLEMTNSGKQDNDRSLIAQ